MPQARLQRPNSDAQKLSLPHKHFIEQLAGVTMKPRAEHEENEENLSLQSGGSRIRSASTHTIEKKTDKQRQNQARTGGGLSGKIQSQAKFRKIGQASSVPDEAAAHAHARAELVEAAPISVAERKILKLE
jgi:hypothetical protein